MFQRNDKMSLVTYKSMLTLLILTTSFALSGCDTYKKWSAGNAQMEYKQTCTGSGTHECESLLVDVNIQLIELVKSEFENGKDEFISENGQEKYDFTIKIFDAMVEYQEEQRPGFFRRNLLGDSQLLSPSHNWLMYPDDIFKELKINIDNFATKRDGMVKELENHTSIALPFIGVRIFSFITGNAYEMHIEIKSDGTTVIKSCGKEGCGENYNGEYKDILATEFENYHIESNLIYKVQLDGSPVYDCDNTDSENRCVSELLEL